MYIYLYLLNTHEIARESFTYRCVSRMICRERMLLSGSVTSVRRLHNVEGAGRERRPRTLVGMGTCPQSQQCRLFC